MTLRCGFGENSTRDCTSWISRSAKRQDRMNLHSLLYASTARLNLTQADLDAIRSESENWNREHEVTGLLVFNGEGFSQVLEGTETAVLTLYDRIRRDPRHTGCVTLFSRPIARRRYPDWAMGFRERTDLILAYDLD